MIKTIVKRNGTKEAFSSDKLNGWGEWAASKLGKEVNWSAAVLHAYGTLPEVTTSESLQNSLIDFCLNQNSWEYNRMAGRLYSALMNKQIHGEKVPTVRELHTRMVKDNLIKPLDYSDEEYETIERIINHKLNLNSTHYELHQLRYKYALRNKASGQEYETQQFIYMRMAMALAENEPRNLRMTHVKNWYDHFSNKRINPPTPNFTNLGTGHNGYASCFPAGTTVDVIGGQKPIETIEVGDLVLGKSGKLKQVVATTSRPYSGEIISFNTALTFSSMVKSTADHRFMTERKNESMDWVEASEVQVGDFLFHPFKSVNETEMNVWDIVKDRISHLKYQCHDNIIGRVNIFDNVGNFSKKHKTCVNAQLKNNQDFYRLVGYYLAEGHITKSGKDNRMALGFTFNSEEIEYVKDAKNILETLFGVSVMVYDDTKLDNCTRLMIHSLPVCVLFDSLCGHGALDKGDKLDFFITSDNDSISNLLTGYIRGDGCACSTGYQTSSISKSLTLLVRDIALRLGYECSVTSRIPKNIGDYKNPKRAYIARITLQPSSKLVAMVGKNIHNIKHRGTRGKKVYTRFVNGGVLTRVNAINIEHYNGAVYDFEVKDDHSFTVDGMCVHNCCVYTTNDSAPSLAAGDHIAYMMTVMSAGIGTHIRTRSLGDQIRGGTIQHQGKLPYYRALVGAIGANLQNGRGGASTVHYTAFDPEVEVIAKAKNPMTPAAKQVRGCDYSFGSNKFFARKAALGEDVGLFSYASAPEVYEAQYSKDPSLFETLYNKAVNEGRITTFVPARNVLLNALNEGYETGRHYLHFTDTMNRHTPFKEPIYSSNLCQEINIISAPYRDVSELYRPYEEGGGEIGLCSLAGIIVSNIETDEQYAEVAYYALKMIDVCIHKSDYVFRNLEDTAKSRLSAGVGVLGLAHLMAKKNHKYSSQEGRDFIHTLFETHMWHLCNASLRLGKELGNAPWMHKTSWPDGWLPIDTYEKRVDDLVTVGNQRDWETLRQKIIDNGGIRNSVLAANMPGESSTIGAGTTNGVYPIRDYDLIKTNETMVINYVAPDSTKLRNKYELAWDIDSQDLIKCYAIMQKWTDQGISVDLYKKLQGADKVGTSEMIDIYLSMVKYGLKSRYYQNSLTAKGISLETPEEIINGPEDESDGYCESCAL